MAKQALVVGFGSIGARHAAILQEMGLGVSVVSRRTLPDTQESYPSVEAALANAMPDYAVIATETATHASDLTALQRLSMSSPILVEKPLFDKPHLWDFASSHIRVGYQLRFHPAVRRLQEILADTRALTASFYVGQHLDQWRAGRSGRESYSGHVAAGGGVLRDLSHELDLACWMFGNCGRVAALGGRLFDVTEDSDDCWAVLAQFEHCPSVTFHLNYLDAIGQRRITVVTDRHTVSVDLIAQTITIDGASETLGCERNDTFMAMHRSVMDGSSQACSFEEGLRVVRLIDAIERAGKRETWVSP